MYFVFNDVMSSVTGEVMMSYIISDIILQTETNLRALEPTLLCGRVLLVNPRNDIKRKDMGITYENMYSLTRKYNVLIVHGNIEVCTIIKKYYYF